MLANHQGLNDGATAQMISCDEAWEVLKSDKNAKLIDVRSLPEWQFCGVPELSGIGKETILLSFRNYPTMETNPNFVEQLQKQIGDDKIQPLLFLCKVGGRSNEAAMTMIAHGYKHCFNIVEGFEGKVNESEQRGQISGWKAENLPWRQS